MGKVQKIEGIGFEYAKELSKASVFTTDDLLAKGSTPQGRQEIGNISSISENLILKWVRIADFFRIKGINEEYSELLEEAGVTDVPALAACKDHVKLLLQMEKVNKRRSLVRHMPSEEMLKDWITQAKKLPGVIKG